MRFQRHDIDRLLEADPFVPFEVHMAGREGIRVGHPAQTAWHGDVLAIEDGEGLMLVNPEQVQFLYVPKAKKGPRARR